MKANTCTRSAHEEHAKASRKITLVDNPKIK